MAQLYEFGAPGERESEGNPQTREHAAILARPAAAPAAPAPASLRRSAPARWPVRSAPTLPVPKVLARVSGSSVVRAMHRSANGASSVASTSRRTKPASLQSAPAAPPKRAGRRAARPGGTGGALQASIQRATETVRAAVSHATSAAQGEIEQRVASVDAAFAEAILLVQARAVSAAQEIRAAEAEIAPSLASARGDAQRVVDGAATSLHSEGAERKEGSANAAADAVSTETERALEQSSRAAVQAEQDARAAAGSNPGSEYRAKLGNEGARVIGGEIREHGDTIASDLGGVSGEFDEYLQALLDQLSASLSEQLPGIATGFTEMEASLVGLLGQQVGDAAAAAQALGDDARAALEEQRGLATAGMRQIHEAGCATLTSGVEETLERLHAAPEPVEEDGQPSPHADQIDAFASGVVSEVQTWSAGMSAQLSGCEARCVGATRSVTSKVNDGLKGSVEGAKRHFEHAVSAASTEMGDAAQQAAEGLGELAAEFGQLLGDQAGQFSAAARAKVDQLLGEQSSKAGAGVQKVRSTAERVGAEFHRHEQQGQQAAATDGARASAGPSLTPVGRGLKDLADTAVSWITPFLDFFSGVFESLAVEVLALVLFVVAIGLVLLFPPLGVPLVILLVYSFYEGWKQREAQMRQWAEEHGIEPAFHDHVIVVFAALLDTIGVTQLLEAWVGCEGSGFLMA
jgi:hypothetical protein